MFMQTRITAGSLVFACFTLCVVATAADRPEYTPDEVIVAYRHVPGMNELDSVKGCTPEATSWRSLHHRRFARNKPGVPHPLAGVRIVKLAPGVDPATAAERIAKLPGVAYAQPNYIMHAAFTPNDPFFIPRQYGPKIVRAEEAWDITTGGLGVIVAVADSAIRLDHEDFQGAIWSNDDPVNGIDDDLNGFIDDFRGWDFMSNDNNPSGTGITARHGTHVAGIVGARMNNAKGVAGMAGCTIMPLQVLNGLNGTWAAIAEAITYAVDNDADIVNYSGGGPGGHGLLATAVDYAWQNDVVVVAASGNLNSSTPYYPASYPGSIAVSATGANDIYYALSGRGPHIDVAAPGISIFSTFSGSTFDYANETGTSMAAPHVSGLVALMLTLNPDLTVEEVRTLLHENAVDLGDPGFDEMFGWGRIDARQTLENTIVDDTPPSIVHDGGVSTIPFSGYIDPLAESSDGISLDLGIDSILITFTEPVRDAGPGLGGGLTADSFIVTGSAVGGYPTVVSIETTDDTKVRLNFSGVIPVGQWTTIIAKVQDFSGNRIADNGNLGLGIDEPDRIDIGFLPGDINQNRVVNPLDLFVFRQIVTGVFHHDLGEDADYIDTDRNGVIQPTDLFRFRQLINGAGNATRIWAGETLTARP
jgi:thermitase